MTPALSASLLAIVTTLLIVASCTSCSEGRNAPRFEDAGATGDRELIVAGRTVTVELAITPPARNMGLMHRTSLDPDRGMLFIFTDSKPRTFWMRNTLIPLDIIFLNADGTVQNIEQGAPMAEVPGYHSRGSARMVLELNAGWAAEHGLKAGDRIEIAAELLSLPKL